ncbi:MAG: AAA family ATPase [Paludibacteraceae bacterium]|nr:AAA family ATPase [Paludibacteraceae bacterium]
MDKLFQLQNRLLDRTPMQVVRECAKNINWNAQLLSIRGPKGVGKTTMILQHIRSTFPKGDRSYLYCKLDSGYFANHTLGELVDKFAMDGGKYLFLDEVHKYENWGTEIKDIYDYYPELQVVISGSSLLSLMEGDVDLSRRCVSHDIQGLSFREYLQFYKNINLPYYSLEQILQNTGDICSDVNAVCKPVAAFHDYLRVGYYPFYQKNKIDYYDIIEQVVNYVINEELPHICKVELSNTRKIKALLYVLAQSEPFEVDMNRLSVQSGLKRETILIYFQHLQKAKLLNLVYSDLKNVKKLQKPDEIYIADTNLLQALTNESIKVGTIRETFAVNQLSALHQVEYGRNKGDFLVDGRYTFEVGGENKDYTQIANLPNSYILADNIEYASGHKLPLWMVGLLY